MSYSLNKLCKKYNIEFNKQQFVNLFKDYLININNSDIIYINEDGLIKFYIEYNITPKLLNIFEYIEKYYNLELGSWFNDIWLPLFEQKDVLITEEILKFIHYGTENSGGMAVPPENISLIKRNFKKILINNNIKFNEIKYDNPIIDQYEYIKNDIKTLSQNNLVQKTWIILSVRNFKSLIMMLNTKPAKEIRDYYISIEEIFYDYSKYISNYNLRLEKITTLQYKQRIENLERSNLQIKNFIDNVKIREQSDYIYITTTKFYASNNNFKIGHTDNLKQRLYNFNTAKNSQDLYYYCYYSKVYNGNKLDRMIQDILIDFKDKKDKELYIMHYSYLEKCVIIAKDNYNEPYDYINDLIKNNLHKMYELRPFIPDPIPIENIYLNINDNKIILNNMDIDEQINIIRDKLKEYHNNKNYNEYQRLEIIKYLNENNIIFNKTKIWNVIKQVGKNLNIAIKYK